MEKTMPSAEQTFYSAILSLQTFQECRSFFKDICTIKELEALCQRLEVAMLLDEGKNYREVCEATGASSATISRVSKCLNYGDGGYTTALERMKNEGGDGNAAEK